MVNIKNGNKLGSMDNIFRQSRHHHGFDMPNKPEYTNKVTDALDSLLYNSEVYTKAHMPYINQNLRDHV